MTNKKMLQAMPFVILGGGPAGCACALAALQEGQKEILVIEKEPYGRHRIGEILLTQTVLEMKTLGIASEMHAYAEKYEWGRKYAAAYVHGEDRTPWRVQNNHPLSAPEDQPHIPREFINPETGLWYTLMVRRHEFDEALREICEKRGVVFLHGAVKEVEWINQESQEETTIAKMEVDTLSGERITLRPRFVVDATGQQAVLPRSLNVRQKLEDWDLQARYAYFTNIDFENAMKKGFYKEGANILSYKDGWVWIANLGRGLVSAGIVSKVWNAESENFFTKLKDLPEYKVFGFDKATVVDHLGNEAPQTRFYAHHNYRFKSTKMRGTNWVCAGDAAMFLDPLLSQGVTLAMSFGAQAGRTAVHILNDKYESVMALRNYEKMYVSEIEVLNKVVSQWYEKDFRFDTAWASTAQKVNRLFGRQIGEDVEAFRWVSNLENIHHIIRDRHDKNFLTELNDVNTIKAIHSFEEEGGLKLL
jgi:flavin-dependent dehydrogenase